VADSARPANRGASRRDIATAPSPERGRMPRPGLHVFFDAGPWIRA
jgi:hypothetical protein